MNKIKYFSKLAILIHTAKMLVKHILCAVRLKYPRSISRFVEYAMHSVKIVSHTKVQSLLDQVRPFNKICSYICLNKNIVNKFSSIFVFVIDNRNWVSRFRVLYIRNGDRALSEGYDCCLCRTLSAGIGSWQVIDSNI